MKTFTIATNNIVTAHADDVWVSDQTVKFTMEQELAALAAAWPGARLVEIWNRVPGAKPVAKFTNRHAGVKRIWKAVQSMEPATSETPRQPRKVARSKVTSKASGEQTKTARIIALLREPAGATLKQLMALTSWQSPSVRGFLSAHVSKRMGLRVKSSKRNGERVYSIKS
jgi:hypothetical protein